MAHFLGDKTQEYAKVWRRHTDPPGLWFAIAIVSVALHLLLFWLMRSYSFSLSRQNQSAIPLEIIEISPQRQLTAKPKPKIITKVLPKPVRQKSRVAVLPKQVLQRKITAKPALKNEDRNALAFPQGSEGKRPVGIPLAQQLQQKLAQQRQQQRRQQELAQQERLSQLAEQQQRRQQELAQQERLSQLAEQQERRQQELAEQQQRRQQELAEQQQRRQQELAEQQERRQQELAQQERLSQLAEQQQRREQELAEQQERRQQELAEQQQRRQQELDDQKNGDPLDAPRTGTGDAPRTQNGGTAQTPPKPVGGLLATLSPSTREELAINTRGDLPTILKDIELPKLGETTGQESNPITIPPTFKLQPGKFIFSLVIEENGKCSNALLQDKNMPSADKKIYEKFGFEEICQKYTFVPAYRLSDRKPLASNLFVSITIEQKTP
jgi:hypothetical protein